MAKQRVGHMDKYIEVFAASDITFAYLMKANLENAGIPVQIANENLQGELCRTSQADHRGDSTVFTE